MVEKSHHKPLGRREKRGEAVKRQTLVGIGITIIATTSYLILLTAWCWYNNPCGHPPVAPIQHYRQILLNLSASNATKIYIRHDVDSCFNRLWPILEVEKELNYTSTICFYPIIVRGLWFRSKQAVNWEKLYPYWASGWVVSYHLNAYERAGYNPERGDKIAQRDLKWLEKHGFPVDRFTPHGGFWHRHLNNCNFTERFTSLTGLTLDTHQGYDHYYTDSDGKIFTVPRSVNGTVYLLVHPEWYGT